MQTFEVLIVFAALMAVIAIVAIAIDWVGRPMKDRRFIPRIYRYQDEIVPDPAANQPMGGPAPVVVAHVPAGVGSFRPEHPGVSTGSASTDSASRISADQAPRPPAVDAVASAHPDAVPADTVAPSARTPARASDSANASAFRANLGDGADVAHTEAAGGAKPERGIAQTIPVAAAASWHADMALDARVGERKATVAVKAERFWKATAAYLDDNSHFESAARALMAQGKAPRRRNPRTGDFESMELIGLRAAADRSAVRMKWPEDAVDPWSSS